MLKLLARYDAYLKRLAVSVGPAERAYASRRHTSYWYLAAMGAFVAGGLFGRASVAMWLSALVALLLAAGGVWATVRILRHGNEFDRTPQDGAWTATPEGRILLDQLRRTCLSVLSYATRATEICKDLGLWGEDFRSLLTALAKDCGVSSLPIGYGPYAPGSGDWQGWWMTEGAWRIYESLTIGDLLDAMAEARSGAVGR